MFKKKIYSVLIHLDLKEIRFSFQTNHIQDSHRAHILVLKIRLEFKNL